MTTKTIANGDRHSMIEYGPLSLRSGHSTIEYGPQSLSLTSRPSRRSDFKHEFPRISHELN